MKILISSYKYSPSIGGIETVSLLLARAFQDNGHTVRILTATPSEDAPSMTFSVFRRPSPMQIIRQISWADVYLQNNISLALLWPALFTHTPVILVHQTWIQRPDRKLAWQDHLKRLTTKVVSKNVAVSAAMARSLPARCEVIPNPYQDEIFAQDTRVRRNLDLIFVGRLVSDKGCAVLLKALKNLAVHNLFPSLMIVGAGPELENLRAQCSETRLDGQVSFVGEKCGADLVHLLNQHRIIVIPSLWAEPFGIVALEGIACGCVAVGSAGGGLPDAIGPCGEIFINGDAIELAAVLRGLLESPGRIEALRHKASDHLARHTRNRVMNMYLNVLEKVG